MRILLSALLFVVGIFAALPATLPAQQKSKQANHTREAMAGTGMVRGDKERAEERRRGSHGSADRSTLQDSALAVRGRGDDQAQGARARTDSRRADARQDRLPWEIQRVDVRGKNGRGPKFCRTGEGHPVYGRQWCVHKGFGLGRGAGAVWGRTRWEDAVFRLPRSRTNAELRAETLHELLGAVVFGRIVAHGRSSGATGRVTGRWAEEAKGPRVLLVHAGPVPLAEFVDYNRDGRVDVVLLNMGQ